MIAHIARRTFSSRSAIRAPPAPPSAPTPLSNRASPMAIRSGRVAMLPKASEPNPLPSTTSQVSTSSASAQQGAVEDVFTVGTVSVPSDEVVVVRMGETN